MIRCLGFFFLLMALGLMSCSPRDNASTLKVGMPAPEFRLDTLDHDRFYLNQTRGKPVILFFWATWCKSCKSEMIEIKSLVSKPAHIVSICIDPENIHDAKQIVKKLGINYPVLLDNGGKIIRKYQFTAVPGTVVINKTGQIRLIRVGFNPLIMKQIRSTIESLLE
jgi:peroxiredoxin